MLAAVARKVLLPSAVLDWLLQLLAWHPDNAVVMACASTLESCFCSHDYVDTWALTGKHIASAFEILGATAESLKPDAPAPAPALDQLEDSAGPSSNLHLLNLQKVVITVDIAARNGFVPEPEVENMALLLFRASVDTRTVPLRSSFEQAISSLLEVPREDAWPALRDQLATGPLHDFCKELHHHSLAQAIRLFDSNSSRCRELRLMLLRVAAPHIFRADAAGLAAVRGDGDIGYFAALLGALTRAVQQLQQERDGYYKLYSLYQLLNSCIVLEQCDASSREAVKDLLHEIEDQYRMINRGFTELKREDTRTLLHLVEISKNKIGAIVRDCAPKERRAQSSILQFTSN